MLPIEQIFEKTGDGATIIDGEQRIVSWNSAATKMFGYSREEAVGKQCWKLLSGRTLQGQRFCQKGCAVQDHIRQGKRVSSFDLLLQHRCGQSVPVNVSTIPIPTNGQSPSMTLVHLWRVQQRRPMSTSGLRIYLLGPTLVKRPDGTAVSGSLWCRVKVRALLAYLVTLEGQPVPRARLTELLWPDLSYEASLRNLNTTVYNLRRSLEPDLKKARNSRYIVYENGQYYMDWSDEHWVDVRAFMDGIRLARHTANQSEAIRLYTRTLAHYRGDYLSGLEDTGIWSNGDQYRLRNLYLDAMEEMALLHKKVGETEDAIDTYRRILAMDSCRETSGRRLMSLLVRKGKRVEAIAICRQLAQSLEGELDILVSQKTRGLCGKLRQAA